MTAHGMLHTDLLLILIYRVTLVLNPLDISALLHKNAGIFQREVELWNRICVHRSARRNL